MSRTYMIASINAGGDVRLHCGHNTGQWTIAVDDDNTAGVTSYVHGTPDELEQFGYAILRIAAGLRVEEVAP